MDSLSRYNVVHKVHDTTPQCLITDCDGSPTAAQIYVDLTGHGCLEIAEEIALEAARRYFCDDVIHYWVR